MCHAWDTGYVLVLLFVTNTAIATHVTPFNIVYPLPATPANPCALLQIIDPQCNPVLLNNTRSLTGAVAFSPSRDRGIWTACTTATPGTLLTVVCTTRPNTQQYITMLGKTGVNNTCTPPSAVSTHTNCTHTIVDVSSMGAVSWLIAWETRNNTMQLPMRITDATLSLILPATITVMPLDAVCPATTWTFHTPTACNTTTATSTTDLLTLDTSLVPVFAFAVCLITASLCLIDSNATTDTVFTASILCCALIIAVYHESDGQRLALQIVTAIGMPMSAVIAACYLAIHTARQGISLMNKTQTDAVVRYVAFWVVLCTAGVIQYTH
jgi:hypothetical protein